MDHTDTLSDCPECRGIRTVVLDVCYVCFAEFGERHADVGVDEVVGGGGSW